MKCSKFISSVVFDCSSLQCVESAQIVLPHRLRSVRSWAKEGNKFNWIHIHAASVDFTSILIYNCTAGNSHCLRNFPLFDKQQFMTTVTSARRCDLHSRETVSSVMLDVNFERFWKSHRRYNQIIIIFGDFSWPHTFCGKSDENAKESWCSRTNSKR